MEFSTKFIVFSTSRISCSDSKTCLGTLNIFWTDRNQATPNTRTFPISKNRSLTSLQNDCHILAVLVIHVSLKSQYSESVSETGFFPSLFHRPANWRLALGWDTLTRVTFKVPNICVSMATKQSSVTQTKISKLLIV